MRVFKVLCRRSRQRVHEPLQQVIEVLPGVHVPELKTSTKLDEALVPLFDPCRIVLVQAQHMYPPQIAAPDRSVSTTVSSQTVAIERPPVAGVHAWSRYDVGGETCRVRLGGTATSTIRFARTFRRTLRAPHG